MRTGLMLLLCGGTFAISTTVFAAVDTSASFIDNTWVGNGTDATDIADLANWKTSFTAGTDDWRLGIRSFPSGTYHMSRDMAISCFRIDDVNREIVFALGSNRTLTLFGSAGIAFRLRTGQKTNPMGSGSVFRLASGTIKQPAYDSTLYNYTYASGKDYCNMQVPDAADRHDSKFIVDGSHSRLETSDLRMRCGTNIWLVVTNGAQVVGSVGLTYDSRTGSGCGVCVAGADSVFSPGEAANADGIYKFQTGGTAENFSLEFLDGAKPWDGVKGFIVGGSGRGATLAFRGAATRFNHTATAHMYVGQQDGGHNRLEITDGAQVTLGYPDVEKPCLTFTPSSQTNPQSKDYIPTDISSPASDAFTWEAWFKTSDLTTATAENRICGQAGYAWDSEGRLVLEIRNTNGDTGGKPKIAAFYRNGNANKRLVGTTEITEGWHHAALVRNGTVITLYLDGAQEATTNDYVNALPTGDNAPFIIAPAFKGSLAEVRVWNTARTSSNIAGAKDYRLAGTETGLAGLWPMSEGTGMPTNLVTGVAATESISAYGYTIGYNQTGNGTFSWSGETFTLMDGNSANGRLWLGVGGTKTAPTSVSNVVMVAGQGSRLVCRSTSTQVIGSRSSGNLLHLADGAAMETYGTLTVGGAGGITPATVDGNSDNKVVVENGATLNVPVVYVGYGKDTNPSFRDSLVVRSGASFTASTGFNVGNYSAYEEYASALFTGEGTISSNTCKFAMGSKSGHASFEVADGAEASFAGTFYVGSNAASSPGTNRVAVVGGGRLSATGRVAFFGDSDTLAITNGTFEAQDFYLPYTNGAATNMLVSISGSNSRIEAKSATGGGISFRRGATLEIELPSGGFNAPVLVSPTTISILDGVRLRVAAPNSSDSFRSVFAQAPTIDISNEELAAMKASLPENVKLRRIGVAGEGQSLVFDYGNAGLVIIVN